MEPTFLETWCFCRARCGTCTDTDSRGHAPFYPKWSDNKTALPDAKQTLFYVSNLLYTRWAFPLFGCLLFSKAGSLLWPSWALQNVPCGPKVTRYHTCCWLFYCYERASSCTFTMFHLQLRAVQPGPTEVFPTAVAQSQRWLLSVRGHGLPPVREWCHCDLPSCLTLKFQLGTSACQPARFCHT